MTMEVYLYFDGNAREAVEFYSKVFSTPLKAIDTYADMPTSANMSMSEDTKNLIMNTSLLIHGTTVMFSDVYAEMAMKPLTKGNNAALIISDKYKEVIRNLFDQLKENVTVENELGENFWSPLYGHLCDQFGVCWEPMVYDQENN